MSYTRTLPPVETQLGPKVERPATPGPEWVATDNPLVERNTRDGTLRSKPMQPQEDELAGLPLDIAYAMRRARAGNQGAALDELARIDAELGL